MAILKIARMGHPVLRKVAAPVGRDALASPEVQRLIDDMLDTVRDYDGVGLAAPQVHASLRIVVLDVGAGMEAWVDPVIEPLTEELAYTFEGCLSVPGLRGLVGRPRAIRVRASTREGEPFERRLEGFPAIVAGHECDHLDGVLYVDKVVPRTLMFTEEYRRYAGELFGGEE